MCTERPAGLRPLWSFIPITSVILSRINLTEGVPAVKAFPQIDRPRVLAQNL